MACPRYDLQVLVYRGGSEGRSSAARTSAAAYVCRMWMDGGPNSLRSAPGLEPPSELGGTNGSIAVMIGRLHHVVLDCADPQALASFYSRLLGDPITYVSDDWVVVSTSAQASGLAFQLAPDHQRPTWPDPAVPQQFHLDVMVEDVAVAARRVLGLGATRLDGEDVFADPAGHPFCLVKRPGWADPIPCDTADAGQPQSARTGQPGASAEC